MCSYFHLPVQNIHLTSGNYIILLNMEKVTVLLSTYNGEKYLPRQLESLVAQQGVEVELLVRDDGSQDTTTAITIKNKKIITKNPIFYSLSFSITINFTP